MPWAEHAWQRADLPAGLVALAQKTEITPPAAPRVSPPPALAGLGPVWHRWCGTIWMTGSPAVPVTWAYGPSRSAPATRNSGRCCEPPRQPF